jgi:hypothetical protein
MTAEAFEILLYIVGTIGMVVIWQKYLSGDKRKDD